MIGVANNSLSILITNTSCIGGKVFSCAFLNTLNTSYPPEIGGFLYLISKLSYYENNIQFKRTIKILFSDIPTRAFPGIIPDEIQNSEMLVSFVKNNMNTILDSWTNEIRFGGIKGRLLMHEDDENDEKNRQGILINRISRLGGYDTR